MSSLLRIKKVRENKDGVVYGFLSGLERKTSYNFHLVSSPRSNLKKLVSRGKEKDGTKIPLKFMSLNSKVLASPKNIKYFEYVDFFRDSNLEAPFRVSVPGTIPLRGIIAFVENRLNLPKEIGAHVASFLGVRKLDHRVVKAVGCSSSSNQHALSEALTKDTSTWWISGDACPAWVEFEVPYTTVLQQVGIIIPKLPYGPLSVRKFTLSFQTGRKEKGKKGNPAFLEDLRVFETLDTENIQVFALNPPVLLCCHGQTPPRFRVVCKTAADPNATNVGFFCIRFS